MTEWQLMIMKLGERMASLEAKMSLILWIGGAVGLLITGYISTKVTVHFTNGKKK